MEILQVLILAVLYLLREAKQRKILHSLEVVEQAQHPGRSSKHNLVACPVSEKLGRQLLLLHQISSNSSRITQTCSSLLSIGEVQNKKKTNHLLQLLKDLAIRINLLVAKEPSVARLLAEKVNRALVVPDRQVISSQHLVELQVKIRYSEVLQATSHLVVRFQPLTIHRCQQLE